MACGEWLRAPSRAAALAGIVLLLLTAAAKRRGWLLAPVLFTAFALAVAQWRLERLERAWPAAREARIEAASGRLSSDLREARLLADSLARRAIGLAYLQRERAFDPVGRLVGRHALESGVVLFEADGTPRVWGGRFRLSPAAAGDSVDVRLTPYYAVLEVRRHAAAGFTAVGAVLLSADGAVPDREGSLAARFRERTEVGLRILPPHVAPNTSDVFDYEEPTTGGTRVLFSVQFVPPTQPVALERARRLGSRQVAWSLMFTLFLAVWMMPGGLSRVALALLPFGLALRAPLGALLGMSSPFDPAVYRSPVLGPLSAAAGPLALIGVVLIVIGALLWERAPPRRWPTVAFAILLLVGSPYVLSELGRGIAPPASGVTVRLWLVWHLTLFLVSAGLMTIAAALLRGRENERTEWRAAVVGSAIAVVAGVLGVVVWNARYGWPDWYTVVWLPALILVTRSADRRAAIAGLAITAGCASALLAWGAEIEGRLAAARRDLAILGDAPDPATDAALRALGDSLRRTPTPRNASELYALWRSSGLGRSDPPVALGVWRANGAPLITLELDELDLPRSVDSALVRQLGPGDSVVVVPLRREPALHHLLLVRTDSDAVLTVAVGPRSALVRSSRLGRLLDPIPPRSPLYRLTLAPAPSTETSGPGVALWRREGWMARGERSVAIAGIPRTVHGVVELGSWSTLAVRGTLVVILDLALMSALWFLAGLLAGHKPRRPAWMPRLRSYEARLGAALTVFFLAPVAGFAIWGLGRLRDEERDGRDRMIEQSLRDVVPPRGALPASDSILAPELRVLGDRVDADLALYRDGEHVAGSSGDLLESLGILGPLMDPMSYHRIAIDGDMVASAEGPSRAVATRIGYRAVRLSDLGSGVLAMPQVSAEPALGDRLRDLALRFLLATLAGVAASLLAARAAARALARPVAELRHAALSFGRGEPIPVPQEPPPVEFAPVFAAFDKMTEDVRRAREAQERVARIVAWGEMASQVAHEIKNPLTPMRLGVQHLRRVYHDGRTAIGPVLEDTTARILAEIDRLDRIARSFSRFGVPASERGPLEAVSLPQVAEEVADLYRLGPEGVDVVVDSESPEAVAARGDEVKETLINLLENARKAQATRIRVRISGTTVAVEDDGCGIPASLLPMIFEPRFSTSTSGSGLGLPIVKRLVEGWGGRVEVESTVGSGTVVRLDLVAAADGPGPAHSPPGTPDRLEP